MPLSVCHWTPTPAFGSIITKPEAQAVDPGDKKPLADAITCLARTHHLLEAKDVFYMPHGSAAK